MIKVIDTFLISEPYEIEILLVKLHCESVYVDKFFPVESCYTFRGQPKSLWLEETINKDERFAPFRDKISVCVVDENVFLEDATHQESSYFKVEKHQRAAPFDKINEIYGNSSKTWLMITDVDEMADFSDENRANEILSCLEKERKPLKFAVRKFWYDFDNISTTPTCIPFVPLSTRLHTRYRHTNYGKIRGSYNKPCCFEYSSCYSKEDIWNKLNSFSHTGYTRQELDTALNCNVWIKSKAGGGYVGDTPHDFFETISLCEDLSVKYVRNNISKLKTYNVNPNYKSAREEKNYKK